MINCALVVESKFSSRKALLRDLEESHVASTVIEAHSVVDGYHQLESAQIDACLLGPALNPAVAEDFVRQGRTVMRNPSCAFIAVLEPGANVLPALRKAGVDGTLTMPYQTRTFTEVCNAAVDVARRRAGRRAVTGVAPNVSPLAKQIEIDHAAPVLSCSLQNLAQSFIDIAQQLARGELKLRVNGGPSLATQDAIRLAIEDVFPADAPTHEIGSFDHYFVSCVVQWFISRINQTHGLALEELRNELNAFHQHPGH